MEGILTGNTGRVRTTLIWERGRRDKVGIKDSLMRGNKGWNGQRLDKSKENNILDSILICRIWASMPSTHEAQNLRGAKNRNM